MRLPDLNGSSHTAISSAPELPAEVSAVFDAASSTTRNRLVELRDLIFRTANGLDAVSELSETLKWGEPSYTPIKRGVGSSVRLTARDDGSTALMFICHTHIVEQFRELYPDSLTFEGNRAIIFAPDVAIPEAETAHCIAMALTWHLTKPSK